MTLRLGDYLLGEVVEEATHTVTYRAKRQTDGRAILLKTVKPGVRMSKRLAEVFERERRLLAEIDHPALPTIIGRLKSRKRLALLLVDHGGQRLSGILNLVYGDGGTRLDPRCCMAVGIEVALALSAIHRRGDAHGGLRPAVVEVTEQGQIYLHGYGSLTSEPGERPLMEPQDLAPEQILGEDADASSDVFQLGLLLYRMLAGRGPFGEQDAGIGQRVRHETPEPLPRGEPAIPEPLRRLVVRCLAKSPRDRYADAASVSSALSHLLRAHTSAPRDVLIARLLVAAGLSHGLPLPAEAGPEHALVGRSQQLRRVLPWLGLGAGLLILAVLGVSWLRAAPTAGGKDTRGIVRRPAQVRVLAHPWAEIHIDGKLVDITPVGLPIEVEPGQHTVVFKHPNAPAETRPINIIAGQTIVLDVQMQVDRPPKPDKPDASAENQSP